MIPIPSVPSPSKFLPALMLLWVASSASSAEAQAPARGDSVVITPSTKYDQTKVLQWFSGAGYRDLWSLPIEVEEADLGSLGGGGLTPIRQGGGFMSHTLHMRGADGREYVMRSVDKFPAQGLAQELQGTFVADISQGIVASLHPTGPLVVSPLLEAAGILHATPTYFRMPDDPRLGEFREAFAGLLVLFEERPRDAEDGGPPFAGASQISNTANFLEAMEHSPRHRLDAREFLKARLIDLLVGDRDRSVNNFLWARFEDGEEHLWRTIPRDRDQAFVTFDGSVKAMASLLDPRLVTFGPEYPSVVGLTRSAWDMDRVLLTPLEEEEWGEVVEELKAALSDAVIEDAVRYLPASHYAVAGAELTETLKIRRDNIHEAAADFYEIVARNADVHLTDHDELVAVERLADGSVRVQARGRSADGPGPAAPHFSRVFRPAGTEEVRIYAHGGDDVFTLSGGGRDAVQIRLVGGGGTDEVAAETGANVERVSFYDEEDTDRVTPEGSIGTHAFRPARRLYWPGVGTGPGTPDFGGQSKPLGMTDYASDAGVVFGVGLARTGFGFGEEPFRYQLGGMVGWATGPGRAMARVDYQLHDHARGLRLEAHALSSPVEMLRYHGFGNETVDTEPKRFYDPDHVQNRVQGMVRYSRSRAFSIGLGANVSYLESDTTQGAASLLSVERPYGSGGFGQVGIVSEVSFDGRDNPLTPTSGLRIALGGAYYPELWDVATSYAEARGEVAGYLSPAGSPNPTLAVRAGGRKVFGTFPFSNGATLGGSGDLRGLHGDRYLGDAVAYGGAEVRTHLFRSSVFLPLKFGGLVFMDVGRVFLDGEDSDTWRNGYGAGLWVSPDVSEYTELDDMRFILSVGRSGGGHALYFSTRYAF